MGTPLTDLLGSPTAIGIVTLGIENAIRRSLVSHPMRHLTEAETKRRFEICVKWFKTFRTDHKFTIERSVNELTRALRAELDGVPFEPHTRSLYSVDEGDDAQPMILIPAAPPISGG